MSAIPNTLFTPKSHGQPSVLERLDRGVEDTLRRLETSEFWRTLSNPDLDVSVFRTILREVCLEIWSYQPTLIEAMMAAVGRYPKTDPKLMKSLALHVGDEADHGHMALQDYLRLGGDPAAAEGVRPTPASFAVMSCWWGLARLADPHAYLGAMYLFEAMTPLVCQKALDLLAGRGIPAETLGFVNFHATEDIKHANLMRHLVEDVADRYAGSADAMVYGMDCFLAVYPMPVWNTALARAVGSKGVEVCKQESAADLKGGSPLCSPDSPDRNTRTAAEGTGSPCRALESSQMKRTACSRVTAALGAAAVGIVALLGLPAQAVAQPATPTTLIFNGDAAPGFPVGSTISGLSELCLSPNGLWAAARANVNVPGQGNKTVVWGISLEGGGGGQTTIAIQTGSSLNNAPAGFTFSNLPSAAVINDEGFIFAGIQLCDAGCTQTINGMALFHATGSQRQLVAYDGQTAWDITPPATYHSFALSDPRMNNFGQFQFCANAGSQRGIWGGNAAFLWKVVATGETFPGIGTVTLVDPQSSSVLRLGSAVIGCQVNFQNAVLAWRDPLDVPPEVVARNGQDGVVNIPYINHFGAAYDLEQDNIFVTLGVNRNTQAGVYGGVEEFELGSPITTPLGVTDQNGYCCNWPTPHSTNRFTAYWRQPCCEGQLWFGSAEEGNVQEILHPHDPLSGAAGHIVSPRVVFPIERYALNAGGRLGVVGTLQPPTGNDYLMVMMQEFNSASTALWPVTLAGTVLEVRPGIFKTVKSTSAINSASSGGDDGKPRWWSNLNAALCRVTFTDDTQSVMLARFCTAAPAIPPLGQPIDAVASIGEFASFGVEASIEGGASWQWRRRIRVGNVLTAVPITDNGRIFGSRTATLSIGSVEAADFGSYDCVITTGCGAVTSEIAELTTGDCPADFDHDGIVAIPDIFAFLSAWFAQAPEADIDGDSLVQVPDIFAFLSLWFAAGQGPCVP